MTHVWVTQRLPCDRGLSIVPLPLVGEPGMQILGQVGQVSAWGLLGLGLPRLQRVGVQAGQRSSLFSHHGDK